MTDLTDNERLRLVQLEDLYDLIHGSLNCSDSGVFITALIKKLAILRAAPPSNLIAVDREEWERVNVVKQSTAIGNENLTKDKLALEADRDRLREALEAFPKRTKWEMAVNYTERVAHWRETVCAAALGEKPNTSTPIE